jgi:hypothetical protein
MRGLSSAARAETLAPVRDEGVGPAELLDLVRESLGTDGATVRVAERRQLASGVHRLRLEVGGISRSVVIKCSDSAMARRNRLVATRWLPAVGMEHSGPPLLGIAAERNGERVWQLYDDLGDCILNERTPDAAHVGAVVEVIAQLHTRFAEHLLLAECRLWGTDFGIQWHASNVGDAVRALEHLLAPALDLHPEQAAVRDHLLEILRGLLAEREERTQLLADHGGPETLLHGDLWPKNAVVHATANGLHTRLIDWDRVGVGPISYDLSTFLSRFPAGDREWILDAYRRLLASAGWSLPTPAVLNRLFSTAECARLANRVIWPAIAVAQGDADRDWAFGELTSLARWLTEMRPLLPQS